MPYLRKQQTQNIKKLKSNGKTKRQQEQTPLEMKSLAYPQ